MIKKPTYEELETKIKLLENSLLVIDTLKENIEVSHSFMNMIFDTIPNPMFYKDINGIYLHCNDSFSRTILGIKKDEIIGKTLYDLPDVIPKEYADIYHRKDNELFLNPGIQSYESEVKCADGKIRYYHLYKSTFQLKDKTFGIVGIMLDISEHKLTLKKLDETNKKLASLSITDHLTDLYNRRYFEDIFTKKLSLLNRYNHYFSLALIDIDFFKDYNDFYGHQAGDEALKKVGCVLKDTLNRPNDYIFRLGGEEFGVLFDVSNSQDAIKIIEKLRGNVEKEKIESSNKTVSNYLTISIGLGNIQFLSNKSLNKDKIYKEVDDLLYKSKSNGRNQITFAKLY
jgi:diguanylate cyclase (GGDEF)-like protein/PAS domain S-box-containing protein